MSWTIHIIPWHYFSRAHFKSKGQQATSSSQKAEQGWAFCENLAKTCPELLHLGSANNSTPLPAALNCLNPEPFPVSSLLILSFKRWLSVIVFNMATEIFLCCSYNWAMIKSIPEHGWPIFNSILCVRDKGKIFPSTLDVACYLEL